MPGATGLIGTNYLYNVAKRDGTAIGMPTSNVPLEPRLKLLSTDGSAVKFDLARFSWIGTPLQEPQVTWVWHTAPAQNVDDLKAHTIVMGATANSADNYVLPMLANALLGTRMKALTGYVGQNEIDIAAERGEVQGNNTGLSNLTVSRADWVRDSKVRILLQCGNERLPVLPGCADGRRVDSVGAGPRHAAVLRPEVHHDATAHHPARCAGRSRDGAATSVRGDHEGPPISRRSQTHRPRHQLARQRRDHAAGAADPGDAAARGRSPARTAGEGGSEVSMTGDGSRGTVGIVRPTQRTGGYEELIEMLPKGVRLVSLCLDVYRGTLDEFQAAIPAYEAKVAEFARMGIELINPSGAPPFMVAGYAKEQELIRRWERDYKVRVFTSGTSNIDAMRAMGVKRFLGVSYFRGDLNRTFAQYFIDAGFDCLAMAGFDVDFDKAPSLPSARVYDFIKSEFTKHNAAQGIYMLGPAWRTRDIIEPIERELGIPVFHAIPVQCWDIQRHLGLREPARGFGRLMAEMPAGVSMATRAVAGR